MRVKFWGTRGSIPTPGADTVRYGGNTSCIEIRTAGGTLIILDCGTGLRNLGQSLLEKREKSLHGHIFITHTHWDHIQGIPFFYPLFQKGNKWDIYAPKGIQQSLRETLSGQMQYTYFPVTFEQLGSSIHYHELIEGEFKINDVIVKTQYLNHPAITLGYRISADGVDIVYATDHEPHSQSMVMQGLIAGQDKHHADFLSNADLVIHDAQYIDAEYEEKKGWGHSTIEYDVELCRLSNVKKLALTHHDPSRNDDALDRIVADTKDYLRKKGSSLLVFAAAEGEEIELNNPPPSSAKQTFFFQEKKSAEWQNAIVNQSVLIGPTDPKTESVLLEAIGTGGIRLLIKKNKDSLLQSIAQEHPSLIILDSTNGFDAIATCLEILEQFKNTLPDRPIILMTDKEEDILKEQFHGFADWLLKPFTPLYARTRIHAWLLRVACKWIRAPMPEDEDRRLSILRWLNILDTAPEERFDRLTRLASALFNMPLVMVTFLADNRQWFKSCQGLQGIRETSRETSFCAHAIAMRKLMIIPDAQLDERFADNPLVTGEPHIRFYAGQPLILPDGTCIGTLCIMDTIPRFLHAKETCLLKDLSDLVIQELLMPVEIK